MERKFKVMMRPTRDCNLRCTYCSVGEPNQKMFMDVDIGKIAVEKLTAHFFDRKINFTWGGGEPLLTGREFYKQIIKFQKRKEKFNGQTSNMVQTNATLITNSWAKFLKTYDFGVGVSIDGPKEVNDKTRVFTGNIGAYDSIQRGIDILEKYQVRHTLLGVIHQTNRDSLDEIVDFMIKQKKAF